MTHLSISFSYRTHVSSRLTCYFEAVASELQANLEDLRLYPPLFSDLFSWFLIELLVVLGSRHFTGVNHCWIKDVFQVSFDTWLMCDAFSLKMHWRWCPCVGRWYPCIGHCRVKLGNFFALNECRWHIHVTWHTTWRTCWNITMHVVPRKFFWSLHFIITKQIMIYVCYL